MNLDVDKNPRLLFTFCFWSIERRMSTRLHTKNRWDERFEASAEGPALNL